MNCDKWQQLAAVRDDLSPAESAALDAHLESCAACRAWQLELDATLQALRQLGEEEFAPIAIPPPALPRINWPALAAAAAVIVMLGAAAERWFEVTRNPVPLPVTRIAPIPPPPDLRQTARPTPLPTRRRARRPQKTEPLLIKIQTNDPQVVVYWLVDGNGQ
jgi:hypothetical protein